MRHVVYATKLDDIRRQREEYDEVTKDLQERYDAQSDEYDAAFVKERKALEEEVRKAIGDTSINLRIRADEIFSRHEGNKDTWKIDIDVQDNSNTSLRWGYDVELNQDGEVERSTNSWSGLKAVTAEQLDDLKESVKVIEKISSLDWASLLRHAVPQYGDFVNTDDAVALRDRKKSRPDFESDITKAEVEERIGKPEWILLDGSPSSTWGSKTGEYYCKIIKETPSRYEIDMISGQQADLIGTELGKKAYISRLTVNKNNFIKNVHEPIETIEEK